MKYVPLLLALTLFMLINSCKSDSTGSTLNNALTSPKIGSIFVYDDYMIDTSGNIIKIDPYKERTDTIIVLSTGISYQGMSNVTNTFGTGAWGSSFYNFEA
jgi:hypothetical protein